MAQSWSRSCRCIRASAESLFSFFDFQRFPVALHFGRGVGFRVAEHMRMPIYQLAREPIENVINRKRPLLLGHLRIEKHLQQQVAEFAGKFVPVAIIDGFEHFISFFERVGLDGIEGLLAIPGTPPGSPQALHDRDGAFETFAGRGHLATTLNEPSRCGNECWHVSLHLLCPFAFRPLSQRLLAFWSSILRYQGYLLRSTDRVHTLRVIVWAGLVHGSRIIFRKLCI